MNDERILSCKSSLDVDVETVELAKILHEALQPETLSVPSDRARATLAVEGNILQIRIEADDLTALRAAMNSYLAWVSASLGAVHSVTNKNP